MAYSDEERRSLNASARYKAELTIIGLTVVTFAASIHYAWCNSGSAR